MISTKDGKFGAFLTDDCVADAVISRITIPASNGILLRKHMEKGSLFVVYDDFSNLFYEKGHTEQMLEKLYWMQRFGLSPAQSILLLDGSANELRTEQRDLALEWNLNGGTTLYKIGKDLKLNLQQIEKRLGTLDFTPTLQVSMISLCPAIDMKMAKEYDLGLAVFLQSLTNPPSGLKDYWNISDEDVSYMRKVLGIDNSYETIDFTLFRKKDKGQ